MTGIKTVRRAARFAALLLAGVLLALGAALPAQAVAETRGYRGFSDVAGSEWFVKDGSLDYAVGHGLITGFDDGTFGPGKALTRGEVVTVLWRMAGSPSVKSGTFDDVDYNAFFGVPVSWARLTGVATGYEGTNRFGPTDPITREQLAVMLANYASKMGLLSTSTTCAALDRMADASSVSSWARLSVGWAVDKGIISGDLSTGTPLVNPRGISLRAELAKMATALHRNVMGGKGPAVENAGVWHYEDYYMEIDLPISWRGVVQGYAYGHVLGNFHTDFYNVQGPSQLFVLRVDGMHGDNKYLNATPWGRNWGSEAWDTGHGRGSGFTPSELNTMLLLVTGGRCDYASIQSASSSEQAGQIAQAAADQVVLLAHVK